MRAEELLPGRSPLALRSGLDPMLFQNAGDSASAHMVIEVGERTLDPGYTPRSGSPSLTGGRPGPRRCWHRTLIARKYDGHHQSQAAAFAAARVNARGHQPSLVRVYGRHASLEATRVYGVSDDGAQY